MNMAFCVECGTKLPEGARFCSSCGKAVAEVAPVVEAVPVAEVTPVVEEAPVIEIASEPETTEVVSEENVYATVDVKTETANEVIVADVEEDAQNVYAESVQVPACVTETVNAEESTSTKEEQQALLDNIYARLRNERLCWKIFGFVWLGYAILFTLLAIIGFPETFPFFVYTIMFVPFTIISFTMVKKVDYYMKTLYTDCEPVVKRCSSIGMIVFGALFNTIAMIFIIINFVNVKSNEKTLNDIKHNQDAYNNRV